MPNSFWIALALAAATVPIAFAQGETTSAIAGSVTDPGGAAIAGATVTMVNAENGLKRSVKTDDAGRFSFPQLKPGLYFVKAEADGFQTRQNNSVAAGLGRKQTVEFQLNIASEHQTVLVTEQAPQINPDNPNTSTTLAARALEDLPNPGGDLTYPLQFAAGALINTAGSGNDFVGSSNGYGNVEFNGLPSLSNGYIVDGLETNDPLTNLNSGLSTNLVLGLNSIAEVTVNTLSYAADQGRYGASQVNYVTKSGTNQFHGNLYELWNGSKLNAADFFTNATPGNHKPRSTVNHFGGSLGGPIVHDKLFFFFDSEWVRIALPIVTATTVPTPAFEKNRSIGPLCSRAVSISATTSRSRPTSAATASTPSISAAAACAASPSRSAITTVAPASANRAAHARPIPEAAPVITMCLPAGSIDAQAYGTRTPGASRDAVGAARQALGLPVTTGASSASSGGATAGPEAGTWNP